MIDLSHLYGDPPTGAELASAPTAIKWTISEEWAAGEYRIHGYVIGHPDLPDNDKMHSSPIVRIDASEPPKWAVCMSRIYRLGERRNA